MSSYNPATNSISTKASLENPVYNYPSHKKLQFEQHGNNSFTSSEIGVQTELPYEGVSCATTAKLLLGVVVSAFGLVFVIFVMKCKFKIGYQMNMCYYI